MQENFQAQDVVKAAVEVNQPVLESEPSFSPLFLPILVYSKKILTT